MYVMYVCVSGIMYQGRSGSEALAEAKTGAGGTEVRVEQDLLVQVAV